MESKLQEEWHGAHALSTLWKDPVARFAAATLNQLGTRTQHPAGVDKIDLGVLDTPKAETIFAFVCGATLGGTCKGFWTVGCCTISSC